MTEQVLGGYVLHEVVGWGAVGQVYRATDPRGRQVAVKVLRPELAHDPDVVQRFLRERSILAGIDHPRVVKVRDLIEEPGTLAIVTDFVAGPNLRGYLAGATLPPAEAARLIFQVLEGLTTVHAAGVVHRDVKPENVLVDTAVTPSQARLSDFGIARLTRGPSLTRLTGLIGTPGYLAPELSQREHATAAADVYSAGIMLYELVTGTTPFATGVDPVAVLLAAREKVPAPVPGFPSLLWEVFASMVARAPGDRPDAAGAARALETVAAGLGAVHALPRLEWPPEPQVPEPERATLLARGRSGSPTDPGPGAGPGQELPQGPGARPRRGRIAPVVALAAAVAVAGSVVAFAVRRPAPATSATFPLSIVGGTVAAGRTWRLEGATLSGHVTLTSAGASTQTVVYDEVIPTSVARSASAVHNLQPAGPQVIENDPVLRFTFSDLAPGESRSLSYEATIPASGSGPAAGRLGRLVADQVKAETAYLARTNLAVKQLGALVVAPGSLVMAAGASQDLTLSGTMNDGTPAPVAALGAAWTSSRPDVATVASGTVRALAPGMSTVRAVVGTLSASATITVTGAATPSATAPPSTRPTASASQRPPTASPLPSPPGSQPPPASPPNPTPLPTRSPTPAPPPSNRTAVVSYDRMAPGAPYWGRSPYGFQSFTAQSNTLTYVGVTWGSGNYQPGSPVAAVTARIRVCSGIGVPGATDVACNGQLADVAAPVVNYGTSAADMGDVAVTPGATYYVVYGQPSAAAGSWDLFWWSCSCPAKGRNSAALSDQNQMVVKGYNR